MAHGGTAGCDRAKTRLVTAVWGTWHSDRFLSVALPSLLAPDNLPAFARQVQASYTIYTRAADAPRISHAPVLQALRRHVEVRVVTLAEKRFFGTTLDRHVVNHHSIWNAAIATAAKEQSLAVLITPDVCWADGSFAYVASLLAQSKRVIYAKPARVTHETFTPLILSSYGDSGDGSIRISAQELTALSIVHSHPLWAMNISGSRHTPSHSELLIEPVSGEGYWMQLLTTDGFVVDRVAPSRFDSGTDDVFVCTDSDRLAAVSLTPLAKDPDWWFNIRHVDALRTAVWWSVHEIPESARLSSAPLRFCVKGPTSDRWADAKTKSDRFVRRARRLLRIVNIARTITFQLGGHRSSVIVAALHSSCWLQRQFTLDESLTMVVPTDAAYADLPDWFWQQVFSHGANLRYLAGLVADYIIRGAVPLAESGESAAGEVEVRAVSGRPLRWKRSGRVLTVDGVRVLSSGRTLGGDVLYLVDGLLPTLEPHSHHSPV
jgi:Fasciclin domain